MVNATVDNKPVSIVLDSGQSTTVPSNETWRVSLYMANQDNTTMRIDGVRQFFSNETQESADGKYPNVTLTGGQTIAEIKGNANCAIFITGFVVNS